ncbi:nuclear transport factor 2 family protein [Brumimicrobium mesophilum]|uniref:nuclear transport factor 2 family protein n=1 Tax=Brumimicrobium mesophilum TaxID=392717 RepID=UPI000D1433E5|nr:nuclear transport factor 2 family protein [Brumimicrobium mesophilum]
MKKIPYNLYIHFEKLNSFFEESTDRKEVFLRCGMASIEFSTFLLGNTLNKDKIYNADKITDILKGIESQFKILSSGDFSKGEKGFQNSFSDNIDNLKLVGEEFAGVIDRISANYFELSKKVEMGLDGPMNGIRKHFNLSEITVENYDVRVYMDYPNVVKMLRINELEYFNSEDTLFMVTHQISECWFKIGVNELQTIHSLIQDSGFDHPKIGHHFNVSYEVLLYLSEHILILEHMVLAEYHPLRVALRGASGGQSQQAPGLFYFSRLIFDKYLKHLENENKSIVEVLEKPEENTVSVAVLNNFSKLERSLKNFFFQHYILSSNIIGSQSFGSIGFDLVSLVDKFVEPIFKEIDQAKYDLTLKTNYQYGNSAGILVLEKEGPTPENAEKHTSNVDTIDSTVNNYFDAISRFDQEGWIGLFSEDGYIEDPIGSRPYIGHKELAIFFKGVIRFFTEFSMEIESKKFEEESIKVSWNTKATSYNGKEIIYKGVEEFKINEAGKIMSAQVEWDPSVIADQL